MKKTIVSMFMAMAAIVSFTSCVGGASGDAKEATAPEGFRIEKLTDPYIGYEFSYAIPDSIADKDYTGTKYNQQFRYTNKVHTIKVRLADFFVKENCSKSSELIDLTQEGGNECWLELNEKCTSGKIHYNFVADKDAAKQLGFGSLIIYLEMASHDSEDTMPEWLKSDEVKTIAQSIVVNTIEKIEKPGALSSNHEFSLAPKAPAGYEAQLYNVQDHRITYKLIKGEDDFFVDVTVYEGTLEKAQALARNDDNVGTTITPVEFGEGAYTDYSFTKSDGKRFNQYSFNAAKGNKVLNCSVSADIESEKGKAALEFAKSAVETYVENDDPALAPNEE